MLPVALLAEGVDRNIFGYLGSAQKSPSPSSRRAWIEMPHESSSGNAGPVALLAEGVDRNILVKAAGWSIDKSPSSRRAWIEMIRIMRVS